MALLKTALLLFVCLEGCALTSASNVDRLRNVPDALRATGDDCQDCTQIFELLADMLSDADLQTEIMDDIENLCALLPGPSAKFCEEEVLKMLPEVISFIVNVLEPAEVCENIGLCGSRDKQEKMLSYFVKEALQVALASENKVQPTTQCSFCIFLIKTLEGLLPKERTEGALIKLLDEVCHILPPSYREECKAVIGKFSKTVLDAILSYATPQAICALIHLCKGQEAPPLDPCTWAAYRCRDIKTALNCGTLFYCQKFAWKPLKTL